MAANVQMKRQWRRGQLDIAADYVYASSVSVSNKAKFTEVIQLAIKTLQVTDVKPV